MNIVKSDISTTIYPSVKEGKYRNYAFKEATVISNIDNRKINLLHRKHTDGKWSMVQMRLDKEQLQAYINELQNACDTLENI